MIIKDPNMHYLFQSTINSTEFSVKNNIYILQKKSENYARKSLRNKETSEKFLFDFWKYLCEKEW